jgi:hypothetical protein
VAHGCCFRPSSESTPIALRRISAGDPTIQLAVPGYPTDML